MPGTEGIERKTVHRLREIAATEAGSLDDNHGNEMQPELTTGGHVGDT